MRRLSTNENLNEPQPLPENWGPIFGLSNFIDRIGDLSWLKAAEYNDLGWFDTGSPEPPAPRTGLTVEEQVKQTAKILLAESDWSMMPDVPMTAGKKQEWEAYRRVLREIKLQPGFPDVVIWPSKPQ